MNKFVQVLVGLCSFVWLVIGVALIAGTVVAARFVATEHPLSQAQQQFTQLRSMLPGGGGQGEMPPQGFSGKQFPGNQEGRTIRK